MHYSYIQVMEIQVHFIFITSGISALRTDCLPFVLLRYALLRLLGLFETFVMYLETYCNNLVRLFSSSCSFFPSLKI